MNLINYQIKGVGVGENQDRGLGIILFHSIKMYFVLHSMVKGLCFDLFQGLCILLEKNHMLWSSCQNRNLAILVANSKFSFSVKKCALPLLFPVPQKRSACLPLQESVSIESHCKISV